jgi:hypothetical protein
MTDCKRSTDWYSDLSDTYAHVATNDDIFTELHTTNIIVNVAHKISSQYLVAVA